MEGRLGKTKKSPSIYRPSGHEGRLDVGLWGKMDILATTGLLSVG